jgi:hypothetical protein
MPCDKTCTPVAKTSGYIDIPTLDENAILAALMHAPVTIAAQADQAPFMLYRSGIIDDPACGGQVASSLDHGLVIVGYGIDDVTGMEYWKIKNSWRDNWGEAGYLRVAKGTNMCGVAMSPLQPKGVHNIVPIPDEEVEVVEPNLLNGGSGQVLAGVLGGMLTVVGAGLVFITYRRYKTNSAVGAAATSSNEKTPLAQALLSVQPSSSVQQI